MVRARKRSERSERSFQKMDYTALMLWAYKTPYLRNSSGPNAYFLIPDRIMMQITDLIIMCGTGVFTRWISNTERFQCITSPTYAMTSDKFRSVLCTCALLTAWGTTFITQKIARPTNRIAIIGHICMSCGIMSYMTVTMANPYTFSRACRFAITSYILHNLSAEFYFRW